MMLQMPREGGGGRGKLHEVKGCEGMGNGGRVWERKDEEAGSRKEKVRAKVMERLVPSDLSG
jgi:hypothetical protein